MSFMYDRHFPTVGFGRPFKQAISAASLRRKYRDEVNDPALRPDPLPPRPPRRDKRGQSKPGRRR